MSIARRIIITLAVALLSLIIVGGSGILGLKKTNDNVAYVLDHTLPSYSSLDQAYASFYEARTLVLRHIMEMDTSAQTKLEGEMATSFKTLETTLSNYEKNLISDDKDKQLLNADRQAFAEYKKVVAVIIKNSQGGLFDDAKKIAASEGIVKANAVTSAFQKHIQYVQSLAEQQKNTASNTYHAGLVLSLAIMLAAIVVTSLFGWRLFRIIASGLNNIRQTVNTVSQHLDFTKRATATSKDEVGDTINAFNQLLERLQSNLKAIQSGAGQVADNARQMADTANQMSATSLTQSEASANVAATVEEMTVSINHVAERTSEALDLARTSGVLAQEGSKTISETITDIREIASTVSQTANTIKDLEAQGAQIGSVVAVIKEVAEQTNLLALNAAIEAARAGEQGRGFAVVADEVRKLAERTATSTQEIARTIEAMRQRSQQATQQMEAAVKLVSSSVSRADGTDSAIHEIGDAASRTSHMVNDISEAISEQSAASTNIAVQIERIAQMTEEATAAASQTAASAHSLDDLAKRQIDILRQYVL
ncbi:methyl-accepting chemotaxis protein [Leeia oryzae]|uniref:methyl-accepting chemotaxis protein n=1 Tax=Leeia oryzae TaxID=356662 RepID=UPI000364728C|nr:methyl-accepting chemotaxis protein [Leeia oryzae]